MFLTNLFTDPIYFLRVIIIVIISISLHELAHGVAALSQGDNTPAKMGHMTLNPVVHMGVHSLILLFVAGIAWGLMPVNPAKFRSRKWGDIIVSAAGPMLNFTLGILCILLIQIFSYFHGDKVVSLDFFEMAAMINLRLFLFKILPIPPLDGFHICSNIFPSLKPLQYGPYGFAALMLLFMNPQFGLGLFTASKIIFTTLQNHLIWRIFSVGIILVVIAFSLLVDRFTYRSSPKSKNSGSPRGLSVSKITKQKERKVEHSRQKTILREVDRPRQKSSLVNVSKQVEHSLRRAILKKVDRQTAIRLIDLEKRKNPGRSVSWYLEKVLYNLDRGR